MSRPGRPQAEIEKAVEEYAKGEQVETLMRRYKVSRAAIYQWINKERERVAMEASRAGKSQQQLEKEAKIDTSVQLMQCQTELERVKKALFQLMLDTGRI